MRGHFFLDLMGVDDTGRKLSQKVNETIELLSYSTSENMNKIISDISLCTLTEERPKLQKFVIPRDRLSPSFGTLQESINESLYIVKPDHCG